MVTRELPFGTAVKVLEGETVEKRITLPGILFTRRNPGEVRKYQDYLRGIGG